MNIPSITPPPIIHVTGLSGNAPPMEAMPRVPGNFPGPRGPRGFTVSRAWVDQDLVLRLELTNGEVIEAGVVSPRVTQAYFTTEMEMIFEYSDGSFINAGVPGGLTNLVGLTGLHDDPNPRLGGDLNLNGHTILPGEGQHIVIDAGEASGS